MTVTVLTPTYNRGDLLSRCHDSLCRQSIKDFEWIIVDDGSTDDTASKVKSWMTGIVNLNENALSGRSEHGGFDMLYLQQPNGGKHRALNHGITKARGELTLILDSDDYLANDTISIINKVYQSISGISTLAGIAARKAHFDGRLIGKHYSWEIKDLSLLDYRYRQNRKGDMCEVYLTHVMKDYSFPEIAGERFCPEALVCNRIATNYQLRYIPDVVYHCEYLRDGLSSHITKIRMESPIASMITYAELSRYDIPILQRVKAAINYYRFALCRNSKHPITGTDMKKPVELPIISRWWCWTKPLGWMMHLRDLKKIKKTKNK